MTDKDKEYLSMAIEIAKKNIESGGGPFGSVVVKGDEIISSSGNRVVPDNDPTAHAEVNVIRKAAKKLNTFNLEGCEIYTSCEPCPMCFGAIYWSRLDRIYFANDRNDAKNIGFDDSFIYDEIQKPIEERKIKTIIILRDEALEAFKNWQKKTDKIEY